MNNRLIQALLSSSILGLALELHVWRADAVIIGSETPNTLSLDFSGSDSYPRGNSIDSDGPLTELFAGQYWKVSAQSLAMPASPAAGRSNLSVQQVILGQDALPSAVFELSLRNAGLYTKQISYLADSPAQVFKSLTCPFQSTNCVSYELQSVDADNPVLALRFRYELRGFFQPSEPAKPVPETSTEIGALAVLGSIVALRVKKRYFTGAYSKDSSS